MADSSTQLIKLSPTTTGSITSIPFNTKDFRDFSFILRSPNTAGVVGDTIDIFIEVSDQEDFSDAFRTRTLNLTSPGGSMATQFTQITGNLTLPADTNTATVLRQKWDVRDTNIDTWLRVRAEVTVTGASIFDNIEVSLLANRKV